MDFSALFRHEHAALQFSGGKDSLALIYLLRPYWDRLTVYHLDTGDLLPEVEDIVGAVEEMVPDFRRIETDSLAWTAQNGLPSDLVPTGCTPFGRNLGFGKQAIVDRFFCCFSNIMQPMHNRMVADGVSLVIRGTKRVDMGKLPAVDGEKGADYELWLPIQEWSHEQVFAYLREVGAPICRVYENAVNAPECATCPAWWSEGRGAYLKKYHPDLSAIYAEKLAAVAREIVPLWENLKVEMTCPSAF